LLTWKLAARARRGRAGSCTLSILRRDPLITAHNNVSAAPAGLAPPRPKLREIPPQDWPSVLSAHFASGLSGWLGYEILLLEPGRAEARLELRDE
jgi:hypothetical protein